MGEIRQQRLLRLSVVVSFILALINHLLPPKDFAATQLLFDYHFGLIRRGLAGSVLDLATGPVITKGEIYLAAAFVTLSGATAFYLFMLRAVRGRIAGMMLLVLALNSFAFASFVGNTGYLDALLLALVLLALTVDGRTLSGLVARILAASVGVLLHENALPYFTVLMAFDLWLARGGTLRQLPIASLPVLVGAMIATLVIAVGHLNQADTQTIATYMQAKAGFRLDPTSTVVASRGIGDNLVLMTGLYHTTKYWIWVLFDGVPLLAMSLWLIWLGNRLMETPPRGMRWFFAAAVLAPISLNAVAFDVVRFGTASVLVGFVAVVLVLKYIPGAWERLATTLTWPHFLLVLVLNANIFTIQINVGSGYTSQFPWVLLTQLKWLAP